MVTKEKEKPEVEKFKRLILIMATDTRYAKALAEFSSSSDCDFLARILLSISNNASNSIHLIRELISYELHKYQHMPQNIFRSNSLASKILGNYVRTVGKGYLKQVLGEIMERLLTENVSLEIDAGKMKTDELGEKEIENILENNRMKLNDWCEIFISRIMDAEMLKVMPHQVRLIASYIAEVSDCLNLNTPILIGSYLILRFFNPAIATPEVYDIIDPKKKSKVGQRNLILISKVVQNLANNVKFGNKETYMICMNQFIEKKTEPMRNFLTAIVDKDTSSEPKFEKLNEITLDDIDISKYDEKDIHKLYRLFYNEAKDVAVFFLQQAIKYPEHIDIVIKRCFEVIQLIEDLGLPPISPTAVFSQHMIPVTEMKENIFNGIWGFVNKHSDQIYDVNFESKFFFYQGKSSIDERPVFYLIANRITEEMLLSRNVFMYHIIKVIGDNFDKPFALTLDMSFIGIFSKHKDMIGDLLDDFSFYIPQDFLKNIVDIFVIHAGQHFATISNYIKNFFKNSKIKRRVKEIVEWNQLMEFIDPENILLPEESKMFVPITYRVIKVNSKGKHQDRNLKITPKSILNIDPKNNTIKNERLLSEIEEVSAPTANLELHMKFQPQKPKNSMGFFSDDTGTADDLLFRRYICSSLEERKVLLEDLFETVVRSQYCKTVQAFQATEIYYKGKAKDRIFKLTNDSIFVVDKRVMKSEIPFVAVEYAKLDLSKKGCLLLKLKFEEHEIEIQTTYAKEMLDSINEGINRTQDVIQQRTKSNSLEMYISEQQKDKKERIAKQRALDAQNENTKPEENENDNNESELPRTHEIPSTLSITVTNHNDATSIKPEQVTSNGTL